MVPKDETHPVYGLSANTTHDVPNYLLCGTAGSSANWSSQMQHKRQRHICEDKHRIRKLHDVCLSWSRSCQAPVRGAHLLQNHKSEANSTHTHTHTHTRTHIPNTGLMQRYWVCAYVVSSIRRYVFLSNCESINLYVHTFHNT